MPMRIDLPMVRKLVFAAATASALGFGAQQAMAAPPEGEAGQACTQGRGGGPGVGGGGEAGGARGGGAGAAGGRGGGGGEGAGGRGAAARHSRWPRRGGEEARP